MRVLCECEMAYRRIHGNLGEGCQTPELVNGFPQMVCIRTRSDAERQRKGEGGVKGKYTQDAWGGVGGQKSGIVTMPHCRS